MRELSQETELTQRLAIMESALRNIATWSSPIWHRDDLIVLSLIHDCAKDALTHASS